MGILQDMEDSYCGEPQGYVYIMEFRFKNKDSYKTLYKVGVTINEPIDRMLQISRSFFQSRRYVPECRLVRFRKTVDFYGKEKEIHNRCKEYNYSFNKSFDGSTEFFDIDIDELDSLYKEVVPSLKG